MDVWQVLGIAPSTDISVLKAAYAAQLKKHRPDRDPEGYQRVREAYELALEWRDIQNLDPDNRQLTNLLPVEERDRDSTVEQVDVRSSERSMEEDAFLQKVFDRAQHLLERPSALGNREQWEFLLSDPRLDSFDVRERLSRPLFDLSAIYCQEHLERLRSDRNAAGVLRDLSVRFDWSSRELEFSAGHSLDTLEALEAVLQTAPGKRDPSRPRTAHLWVRGAFGQLWQMLKAVTLITLALTALVATWTWLTSTPDPYWLVRKAASAERYGDAHTLLDEMAADQGKLDSSGVMLRSAIYELQQDKESATKAAKAGIAANENLIAYLAKVRESPLFLSASEGNLEVPAEMDPADAQLLNWTAWELATGPNATQSQITEAVVYADAAARLTNGQNGAILDTLAAALAAAGNFEIAVDAQRKAIELLEGEQRDGALDRLTLYQQEQPYHDRVLERP